jgi:UrcA family protein
LVGDGRPAIHLSLTGYDLGQDEDVRDIKVQIRRAANRVCVRGASLYLETVACVKSAVSDADQQLNKLLARDGPDSPIVASISVSVSAK